MLVQLWWSWSSLTFESAGTGITYFGVDCSAFCLLSGSLQLGRYCSLFGSIGFSLVGLNTEILLGQMLVSFRWVAQ